MKNLVTICVVLTLLNTFMGAGYGYDSRFSGIPGDDPLHAEEFVNSYLPIDSFVLPGQGNTGIINLLIKTSFPILIFTRPTTILSFHTLTEVFYINFKIQGFNSALSLIRTAILRI